MIRNSFILLERLGKTREKKLWEQGITSWEDFFRHDSFKGIPKQRKMYYDRRLREAQKKLYSFDAEFFAKALPETEHWRLYDFFRDECVFLDIETTGLSDFADITVVGLFDGVETKTMVKHINLDFDVLKKELAKYKMVVTFNGATFDIPFMNKRMKNIVPKIPHFDLRHGCARVGLTGGLKVIEKRLGIKRNRIVEEMYGGDALLLWRKFMASGDDYYLKLLIEYNEEDIINLRKIADHVYGELKRLEGF